MEKASSPGGRKKLVIIGLAIFLAFGILAVFAGFIAPYGENEQVIGSLNAPPSGNFLLGTQAGRDVLSRIIFGVRGCLKGSIALASTIVTIGIPLGLAAGYSKYKSGDGDGITSKALAGLDLLVRWFSRALVMLPWIVLIVSISIIGTLIGNYHLLMNGLANWVFSGLIAAAGICLALGLIIERLSHMNVDDRIPTGIMLAPLLALGVLIFSEGVFSRTGIIPLVLITSPAWAGLAILIRKKFPSPEENHRFKENFSVSRHILPAIRSTIVLGLAAAVLITFMMNFLGFGAHPPTATLGGILRQAQVGILSGYWWLAVVPGVAVTLLVTGLYLMGEPLRKDLDEERSLYLQGPNAQ